eukprot:10231778-Lingulodinium_polyedra.AAC.1
MLSPPSLRSRAGGEVVGAESAEDAAFRASLLNQVSARPRRPVCPSKCPQRCLCALEEGRGGRGQRPPV